MPPMAGPPGAGPHMGDGSPDSDSPAGPHPPFPYWPGGPSPPEGMGPSDFPTHPFSQWGSFRGHAGGFHTWQNSRELRASVEAAKFLYQAEKQRYREERERRRQARHAGQEYMDV